MKIGVDAKWFFEGPPSGRVVIRNLVKNIALLETDDEFYVFLNAKNSDQVFPYQQSNIHLIYVWGGNNLLSNVFVIPFAAWNLHLDIFIFQNFAPLFTNFKRYSFIHCVLFKSNPDYFTLKERLYFMPLKILARYSHGICTVSHAEKSRMIQYGYGTNDSIDVVYHGVDTRFMPKEKFAPNQLITTKQKFNLPESYILYVGRLNIVKNISNLVKAISFLKTKTPLVIVGDYDWKMTKLDTMISSLGLTDRIIFIGSIYGDELPVIYSLATVFCFPSFEESFGLPALEAMASGIPVAVSDRSSLPEICGDAGNYFNPESPQNIAETIDNLLRDNDLYKRKQILGLERSKHFTWNKSSEALLKSLYKTMGDTYEHC